MFRFSATRLLIGFATILAAAACGRSSDAGAGDSVSAAPPSATPAPAPRSDSALMAEGIQLLYQTKDPAGAAETFRAVLRQNPTHYGAHLQLAKALDGAGKPTEARPIWTQVLDAAVTSKDTATANAARRRLAQPDTVGEAGMMAIGLDLLYTKKDAPAASEQFRAILRTNPRHYGATLQLAKALDIAGKPAEARPYWEKILTMAEAVNDQATAGTARTRLLRQP